MPAHLAPLSTWVSVISAREIASSTRFAVGRSVTRFAWPGYNPFSFSPLSSCPRRTKTSNNINTRNASVTRWVNPCTWSSRRTNSGRIPSGWSLNRWNNRSTHQPPRYVNSESPSDSRAAGVLVTWTCQPRRATRCWIAVSLRRTVVIW